MDILDEALLVYQRRQAQMAKEDDNLRRGATLENFRADFGCEPDRVDGDTAYIGDLELKLVAHNLWAQQLTCLSCGRWQNVELIPTVCERGLTALGRAVSQRDEFLSSHTCPVEIDYDEMDRLLNRARRSTASGSACEAELAQGLVIAMALVAIAKELSQRG